MDGCYVHLTQGWLSWVQSVNPEHSVPECWETERQLSECDAFSVFILFFLSKQPSPLQFSLIHHPLSPLPVSSSSPSSLFSFSSFLSSHNDLQLIAESWSPAPSHNPIYLIHSLPPAHTSHTVCPHKLFSHILSSLTPSFLTHPPPTHTHTHTHTRTHLPYTSSSHNLYLQLLWARFCTNCW